MPDPNLPVLRAWVSWTTDPLDTPDFTGTADITNYLLDEGFSIRRGRTDPTAPVAAGRLTFALDNQDRRFDPEYTSSPYAPNVVPMKRVQINMQYPSGGTHYVLFSGFVESWEPDYAIDGRSICRVTAVDAFGSFFARQALGGEVYVRTLPASAIAYVQAEGLISTPNTPQQVTPLPVPGGRKISWALTGTLSTGLAITIRGTNAAGIPADYQWGGFPAGWVNPSGQTSGNIWEVQAIVIEPTLNAGGAFASADAGKPLLMTIDSVMPAEYSGDALNTLLNATRWPAADRSIQSGVSLLQSYTLAGSSALSYIQLIADSERGVVFMDRTGKVVFKNRHNQILNTTSVATFGDGVGELPYEALILNHGAETIYNQATFQRVGGNPQYAQDATSTRRFLARSYPSRGQTIESTDNDALAAAQWVVARNKNPKTVVAAVDHAGQASPTALWPVILGGELQNLYTVIRRPPGGGTITQQCVLESIEITIDAYHAMRFRWGFSDGIASSGLTFLLMDDATYGRVDYNAVAF